MCPVSDHAGMDWGAVFYHSLSLLVNVIRAEKDESGGRGWKFLTVGRSSRTKITMMILLFLFLLFFFVFSFLRFSSYNIVILPVFTPDFKPWLA